MYIEWINLNEQNIGIIDNAQVQDYLYYSDEAIPARIESLVNLYYITEKNDSSLIGHSLAGNGENVFTKEILVSGKWWYLPYPQFLGR
jgi:hypothetical protein